MYIREYLLNKIKEVFDVKPLQSNFFNTDIFSNIKFNVYFATNLLYNITIKNDFTNIVNNN